jgi:hypothetical protein
LGAPARGQEKPTSIPQRPPTPAGGGGGPWTWCSPVQLPGTLTEGLSIADVVSGRPPKGERKALCDGTPYSSARGCAVGAGLGPKSRSRVS